jgi:hypothetical protein
MEPLPLARPVGRSRRLALNAAPILVALTGCVGTTAFTAPSDAKPSGTPAQVVVTWTPKVVFAPDPVHGGAPTPGLAGRMYLFGPQIDFPLVGDGGVGVDLFDATPREGAPANRPPVLIEQWHLDKDTLHKLLRKDMIGWGYTLFLPWGTYKPEIAQVVVRLHYEPAKGAPLYANNAQLSLNKDAQLTATSQKVPLYSRNPAPPQQPGPIQPAGHQVAAPQGPNSPVPMGK